MAKQTGEPTTFVIEVGPITYYNMTEAEMRRAVARARRAMHKAAADYWQVGLRSKVVRWHTVSGPDSDKPRNHAG